MENIEYDILQKHEGAMVGSFSNIQQHPMPIHTASSTKPSSLLQSRFSESGFWHIRFPISLICLKFTIDISSCN